MPTRRVNDPLELEDTPIFNQRFRIVSQDGCIYLFAARPLYKNPACTPTQPNPTYPNPTQPNPRHRPPLAENPNPRAPRHVFSGDGHQERPTPHHTSLCFSISQNHRVRRFGPRGQHQGGQRGRGQEAAAGGIGGAMHCKQPGKSSQVSWLSLKIIWSRRGL